MPAAVKSGPAAIALPPVESSCTRWTFPSNDAMMRLPFMAPPKFSVVYSVSPLVDSTNTVIAPLWDPASR